MRELFGNYENHRISAGAPNAVQSPIEVSAMTGTVTNVQLAVAIDHTWVSDLVVVLSAPTGQQVTLARSVGRSGDDMEAQFSDAAPITIEEGSAPYVGTFRPTESLSSLNGVTPNGIWRLTIVDEAWADGGELNAWAILITTAEASQHPIDVVFGSGLTAAQQAAFNEAADTWSQLLRASVPPVQVGSDVIDGVRIDASGIAIDGPNGILGQAGPVAIRSDTMIPATGMMQFDTGDLANMELHGNLVDVIIHEMGHVLGIGTLWKAKLLLAGSGTMDPTFVGPRAMTEYTTLTGAGAAEAVPVANTGGPGTREGHWREAVFGNELMTGFVDTGTNPLSRLTIASLADLGYSVDIDAADHFIMPNSLQLALMGVGSDPTFQHCCTLGHTGRHPGLVPLPPDSVID